MFLGNVGKNLERRRKEKRGKGKRKERVSGVRDRKRERRKGREIGKI